MDTDLKALFQEILECDEKMSELLQQKAYTYPRTKYTTSDIQTLPLHMRRCVLRVFTMWYLRTFELSSPSVFSELGGMHYAPDNVADTMVQVHLPLPSH